MTRSRSAATRSGIAPALLVGLWVWAAGVAAAADGEVIPVNVLVTHLSNEGAPRIDPSAQFLDKRMRGQIVYDSMRVVKKRRINLQLDEVGTFNLPNGKAVRLRPIHKGEKGVLMAVDVEGAAKLDIRVKSHHPVVIRAGPYKGGSLVLSLELDY